MLIGRVVSCHAPMGEAEFLPQVRLGDFIYYKTVAGMKVMCQITRLKATSYKGFHGRFVILDESAALPKIWDNLYLSHQRIEGHIEIGVTQKGNPVKFRVNPLFSHVLVAGKTLRGKTHVQIVMAEEFLINHVPSIIIDPHGQFINLDVVSKDAIVTSGMEFEDLLAHLQDKKTVVFNQQGQPNTTKAQQCLEILSQLTAAKEKDYQQAGNDIRQLRIPPVIVNIDETEIYAPTRQRSVNYRCRDCIIDLAKRRGKFGIGLVLNSQRLAALHYDVRSQCNSALIFHLSDSGSRQILAMLPYITSYDLRRIKNLERGYCIITGELVPHPVLVQIRDVKTPRAKNLDFEQMLGLTPIPTIQEADVTDAEIREFQVMIDKGITFEELRSRFPTRTIAPHGECIVIPERFFKKGWNATLETEGYKVVHCPDMAGGSVYLVRNDANTLKRIREMAKHLPRDESRRDYKETPTRR